MTALSIQPPFPTITDIDGQPLEDGYIWIGVANLPPIGNPIAVYWDAALTQPAALPVRTRGGYPVNAGTPARLYVNSDYSIQVQNKNGSVVYSAPAATERYGNVINAEDVAYDPPFANAVQTNVEAKLSQIVSVKDFGAVGDGVADDTFAIQTALNETSNGAVWFPPGTYLVNARIENTTSCSMYGYGQAIIKLADGVNLGVNYQDRVVWIHDCTDVVIDGMTIDENKRGGTFATGSLLLTRCDRAKVTNNLIYDNDGMGITCGGEFGSPGDCEIVLIDRNIVYPLTQGTSGTNKSQEGIKTSGNRRVTISNNYMRTFYDDGISLNGLYTSNPASYDDGDRDVVIAGNVIEAWSRPIIIDGWCENIVISGNTCRKMNGAPAGFGQPLILVTNVINTSIATSYARNVSIVGNVCEVDTDYSTEVSAIAVNCGVGIVISGNTVRKDGAAAPTKPGIEVAPTAPAVETLIGVKIADNSIHGYQNGVYVAASGSDWPIDIAIDGNLIQNVSNPVYFVGDATAIRNWSVSNNKTNSPNGVVWGGAIGVFQEYNNTWNFGSAAPTSGTWALGQQRLNTSPASAGYIGFVCTAESVVNTGSISSGSPTLTVGTNAIQDGEYVTVAGAGVAGADLTTTVLSGGGTATLTLNTNASTTVSGAKVTTPGTWKTYGLIS